MEIEVSSEVEPAMLARASAAYPREACGLLLGRAGTIETATLAANVHSNPDTHFEIDPQALVDAHRAARAGGPEVIGYWHSHPHGPPAPSATDRAHGTGDGRVWAIVGEGRVGWWRDSPGGFVALSYRNGGG
ncbi:Mov34/MPN/PAD-1 family protein [Tsuneonella amylolytica]|uniref:Mov34/MPN/PAD-1 family protein n=1 Tax=Tsuneonella amylolytica TaxID=2338327 RepID=UPI000EA9793B|nr:M67 family metallopeptidase [Tsuneonella amylolytica]